MNRNCLNLTNPIQDAITRIRFAPNTNNLLFSSWDSILRLYDVDKCQLRLEIESVAQESILDCCFETDLLALTVGSDGTVARHDMHLGTSKAIGSHEDLASSIEYSRETGQIFSAGWDKKVRCWDARLTKSIGVLSNLDWEVESMTLSGYNLMIAVGSFVYIHDLRRSDQASKSNMDLHTKCVRSISNFEGFAVGSIDGRVALEYLPQSRTKNEGYAFRCHPKDKSGRRYLVAVNDIAFNPSIHGVFVTGDNEGHASIWDAASKKRLLELPRYPNSIASLAYNHDGQLLAVASSHTYQEAREREEAPQIYLHHMDDKHIRAACSSS